MQCTAITPSLPPLLSQPPSEQSTRNLALSWRSLPSLVCLLLKPTTTYTGSHEKLRSLSYKQIYRYFNDMNNERIGNLLQKANVPDDCLPPPQSKLINFLRSRSDISYIVYTGGCPDATNGRNFWLFNESGSPGKPNSIVLLDELCPDAVEKYKEQRQDERLNTTQLQLVGAAWCTMKQKWLLSRLTPPLIPTMSHVTFLPSPQEPLLGSTSYAFKFSCQIVRPSTFRWVFQVVLPDLFGHDVMHRIQMLMTDGDRACTNCEPGRAQNVNQNARAQNVNQKKATKLCVL